MYCICNKILTKKIDGEILLYNRETSTIHHLNSTAARIWELLGTGAKDIERIARCLADEFDVDHITARADTEATLQALVALGVVSADGKEGISGI